MIKILFAATIILVGLKLSDVIEWPWLAILSPIWLPLLTIVIILLGAMLLMCIGWLLFYFTDERKSKNDIRKQ